MLRALGLARRTAGGIALLEDLSLTLEAGERLALAGPSGSGKSLLLRALALLDPVDAGEVIWLGSPPTGDRIPSFRREVLYVQQKPLITEERVENQLALPWTLACARGGAFDRDRALDLLRRTGRNADFMRRRGAHLSGGEAQLVALVRALLVEPRALLLDEPTAAMDEETRDAAEALLTEWFEAQADRAWIWVSHDREQLERTCTSRAVIDAGRRTA